MSSGANSISARLIESIERGPCSTNSCLIESTLAIWANFSGCLCASNSKLTNFPFMLAIVARLHPNSSSFYDLPANPNISTISPILKV